MRPVLDAAAMLSPSERAEFVGAEQLLVGGPGGRAGLRDAAGGASGTQRADFAVMGGEARVATVEIDDRDVDELPGGLGRGPIFGIELAQLLEHHRIVSVAGSRFLRPSDARDHAQQRGAPRQQRDGVVSVPS
jgi:hypothetical protein